MRSSRSRSRAGNWRAVVLIHPRWRSAPTAGRTRAGCHSRCPTHRSFHDCVNLSVPRLPCDPCHRGGAAGSVTERRKGGGRRLRRRGADHLGQPRTATIADNTHSRATAANPQQGTGQSGGRAGSGQRLMGVGCVRVQTEQETDLGRSPGGQCPDPQEAGADHQARRNGLDGSRVSSRRRGRPAAGSGRWPAAIGPPVGRGRHPDRLAGSATRSATRRWPHLSRPRPEL